MNEHSGNAGQLQGAEDLRQAVHDALGQALGDSYDCTRVWEAWQVGTMSQDDFSLITDDSDRMSEITDAVLAALAARQPVGVVEEVSDASIEKAWSRFQQAVALTDDDIEEFASHHSDEMGDIQAFAVVDFSRALLREFSSRYTAPPAPAAVPVDGECGNCHDGKSDMDHDCRECGGTGQLPPAPAVPIDALRDLLARRIAQWRSHIPANPDAPGTRAIETTGETDYNNDVAIWRQGIAVMDEALALLSTHPQPAAATGVPELFVQWLEREMPAGTIIGKPAWWAPKLARALRSAERGVLGGCNG